MTGAPAAVGKQASQSPMDETTAWDEDEASTDVPSATSSLLHPWKAAALP